MSTEPNVVLVSDDGAERVVFLEPTDQISHQVLAGGSWAEKEICFVMGASDRDSAETTARDLFQFARPMRCSAH